MLTDVAIRRLKPRDKPFKVGDMHGLYLLVKPDGARYWRMDFRHAGKRGTVALGIYPHVSLQEAREERASARKPRSEERRAGKECVSKCRSRGQQYKSNKNN